MKTLKRTFARYQTEILIGVILVLAAFFRFYRLDSLPPGLHPDEAANGLDVFRILEHHALQPFFPANGGREALFFYLQAISVKLLGNTIFALRFAPAVIGVAAVGAVYLWASNWFGRRIGTLAALLMAVTPWGVTISRDGFRAGMVALMVPLTLWLYTKAIRSGSKWWFVGAGFSLGLGLYTYTAFRLFAVAIVLIAIYAWWRHREVVRSHARYLLISALVAVVTLIPLGIYAMKHFSEIAGRSGGVSITNPDRNHGNLIKTAVTVDVQTALMFNVHGDDNYRHNLGGQPELNIYIGIMFVLGLILALTRLRDVRYFALLAVFLAMLLPETLTAEGIPHALRAIGALPEVLVLAALGIAYLLDQWASVFPLNAIARAIGTAAVALLLVLTIYQGYVQYFVAWANSPQTFDAYNEDTTELASFYNDRAFSGARYAVGGSYRLGPVEYLTHNHSTYTRLDESQLAATINNPHQAKEFAVLAGDERRLLPILKKLYPTGGVTTHNSSFSGKELFVVYTVSAS